MKKTIVKVNRPDPFGENSNWGEQLPPIVDRQRVTLVCNECGKTFRVSPNAFDPECPKCGGVDWEVK